MVKKVRKLHASSDSASPLPIADAEDPAASASPQLYEFEVGGDTPSSSGTAVQTIEVQGDDGEAYDFHHVLQLINDGFFEDEGKPRTATRSG